jgi:pimeloyl-ACP methyl ester carboxylesterase
VDVSRVGILGVSFGAQVALQAAREIKSIRAVVLESIGPVTINDHGGRPRTFWSWINYPVNWLLYLLFDFMSGINDREGVMDALRWVYPRPILFVSTGRGKEQYFMRRFYQAARPPKSILEVPTASHGIAAIVDRRAYRERVLRVFRVLG